MIRNAIAAFSTQKVSRLFLFAGQGTQEVGMLGSVEQKDREDGLALAGRLLGLDMAEIVTKDEKKLLGETEVTQPMLLLSHFLHFRKGQYHQTLHQGDWMIGHSIGQYSALVNAESLELDEGLKLVHLRGQLMKKYTTSPHGMLIIKFKPQKKDEVQDEIRRSGLEIACINTRTSLIVAGEKDKIFELQKDVKKHQAAALTLPVSTAFHCKMLEAMKQEFQEALTNISFKPPKCTIYRNFDCKPYRNAEDIREGLLMQLTNPVLFQQSVQLVPQTAQLIEVGHKRWISKFADEVRRQSFMESLI